MFVLVPDCMACFMQAKLIKVALEAALTKLKAHFQGKRHLPAACAFAYNTPLPSVEQQNSTLT